MSNSMHKQNDQVKSLAYYTRQELIISHLKGRNPREIILELALCLKQAGCITDFSSFHQAILRREAQGAAVTEAGFAMPHARVPRLERLTFAYGRIIPPMPWNVESFHPIHSVFLIAIPSSDSFQHLQVISGFARLANNDASLAKLKSAHNHADIMQVFSHIELKSVIRSAAPVAV